MHRSLALVMFLLAGAMSAMSGSIRAADMPKPVTFACEQTKTIEATFHDDEVDLKLSDARSISLPQAMSGSGARYANADESLVFWNKGNTAFITEGDPNKPTYAGCVTVSNAPGTAGWRIFASTKAGFSIRYPEGWTVNPDYRDESLGTGKEISGVSFTIPAAVAKGTNLATDTHLAVETLPGATSCIGDIFLSGTDRPAQSLSEGGTDYSVARFSDAGAGNFYEQTAYALTGTSRCLAVVYFIHSANIGNFDPGTVKEFNKAKLLETFDKMRRSLVIGQ